MNKLQLVCVDNFSSISTYRKYFLYCRFPFRIFNISIVLFYISYTFIDTEKPYGVPTKEKPHYPTGSQHRRETEFSY